MVQIHKNNESALYWVKQAISNGYIPAEKELETWYLQGIMPGNSIDLAASIYLPKAQAGDPVYMLKLSEVYRGRCTFYSVVKHHNNLTDRDNSAALWRQRAAEAGNIDAQILMGDAYHYGWNVNSDRKQALHWYRIAADNGSKIGLSKYIDEIEDDGSTSQSRGWSRVIDKDKDLFAIEHYLPYYKKAAIEGCERAIRTLLYFIRQGYDFPYSNSDLDCWTKFEKS